MPYDEEESRRRMIRALVGNKENDVDAIVRSFGKARVGPPPLTQIGGPLALGLAQAKPLRSRTYIAFDGDTDLMSYRTIQSWSKDPTTPFTLIDAHKINNARDDSLPDSICRQIKERLDRSRNFVLIVGSNTNRNRKGILQYEIRYALRNSLPIVLVFKGFSAEDGHDNDLWRNSLFPRIPRIIREYSNGQRYCLVCPFTQPAVTGAIRTYSYNSLPAAEYTWYWR